MARPDVRASGPFFFHTDKCTKKSFRIHEEKTPLAHTLRFRSHGRKRMTWVLAIIMCSAALVGPASGLVPRPTGDVLMMRHGQSTFNQLNRFCGWADNPLTPLGAEEALTAAESIIGDPCFSLLSSGERHIDVVFTSRLQRAVVTAERVAAGIKAGEVQCDWRLNEQMYGALTGLNKRQAMIDFGFTQVEEEKAMGFDENFKFLVTRTKYTFDSVCRHFSQRVDSRFSGGGEAAPRPLRPTSEVLFGPSRQLTARPAAVEVGASRARLD